MLLLANNAKYGFTLFLDIGKVEHMAQSLTEVLVGLKRLILHFTCNFARTQPLFETFHKKPLAVLRLLCTTILSP